MLCLGCNGWTKDLCTIGGNMSYVLAVASTPRNYIDVDLKVFDTEEYLRQYLKGIDMCSGDVELLFTEGKLIMDDESFAITVVA